MINAKAYKNYFGGKNSPGTYQTIINHIPPHDVFFSLFLGNCAITRNIKPAAFSLLNDLDSDVIEAWKGLELPCWYKLMNLDAIDVLKRLPAFLPLQSSNSGLPSNVFIYLDPPYRKEVRKGKADVYKHQMTDSQHSALLSQVIAMPDRNIMISHYPDTMYDEVLKGWNQHTFLSTIRNGMAWERIYFNYNLTEELHDYSYIGNDFREREANNRIKKNFVKKLKRLPPQLRNSILQDLKEL